MRASKLKPILVHPGIGELLALHRADALATGRSIAHVEFCEKILQENAPHELNPAPLITGDDLVEMGLTPGPIFKDILESVRVVQLENQIHTKADALVLVKNLTKFIFKSY